MLSACRKGPFSSARRDHSRLYVDSITTPVSLIQNMMKYDNDAVLPPVTDDMLKLGLADVRPYTVCILKAGPRFQSAGLEREHWVADLVWQHGKRNYALYLARLQRIICPISDDSAIRGIGVFDADEEETNRIMCEDPGVKAGIFTYELHATRTFPDSTLQPARWPDSDLDVAQLGRTAPRPA